MPPKNGKRKLAKGRKTVGIRDDFIQSMGGYDAVGMVDPAIDIERPRRWFRRLDNDAPASGAASTSDICKEDESGEPKEPNASVLKPEPLKIKDINTDGTSAAFTRAASTDVASNPLAGTSNENNHKRKKAAHQNEQATASKTVCSEANISAKDRNAPKRLEEEFPLSDVKTTFSRAGKEGTGVKTRIEDTSSECDTQTNRVHSVIPSGIVPVITGDESCGKYELMKEREKALKKSEFAIIPQTVKSWVYCAVCKVHNEEGTQECLTVILDPQYYFHPRAWNEHIQSEEHMKVVDNRRREELQKTSQFLRIINGSSVRCTICSGNWREGKEQADDRDDVEDYEGVVILDPIYPYHARAWQEHAESWNHIDNWTAMNRGKLAEE